MLARKKKDAVMRLDENHSTLYLKRSWRPCRKLYKLRYSNKVVQIHQGPGTYQKSPHWRQIWANSRLH